jgi:hypothetical protein
MPEYLKALVVILGLAGAVFALAKNPVCAGAMSESDFERRRNLWLAVTLIAFLAHNFWLYIVFVAFLLLLVGGKESNKLAMFFFLLFAIPAVNSEIGGIGGIRHFFNIHYIRLLALVILVPAFLAIRRDAEPFGRLMPDKLIGAYMILNFLLMLSASTFTNTLRHAVFYVFIDTFLPYYVASRSLKRLEDFRDVSMAFVIGALVLSAVGIFESARHWLLYAPLQDALNIRWGYGNYLSRVEGGELRAQGSTGHPIAFGYVTAVAASLLFYLRGSVANKLAWSLGMVFLIAGLVLSVSRGPWVGAVTMVLVFVISGKSPVSALLKLGLAVLVITPVLLESSLGQTIVDHLPFIGTIEEESVNYRQRLLEISVQVILQNPFFGAFDYIYSPAMQDLTQGEGIIDIVNTYLGIGLASGLVGLSLFSGFFLAVAIGVFKAMSCLSDKTEERYILGRALLAVLSGILVIIFTVSSISVIPVIYWCIAGLGVAYARVLAPRNAAAPTGAAEGSFGLPSASRYFK